MVRLGALVAEMGRRRAKAAKVVKKAKPVMKTEFKCPFCNHEGAVECKLDYDKESGSLECRVCGANYSATINYLSEPIDIFSEWIDHCEAEDAEDKDAAARGDDGGGYDDFDDDDEPRKRQRVE